jgi:hypothetical protein
MQRNQYKWTGLVVHDFKTNTKPVAIKPNNLSSMHAMIAR